MTGRNGWEFRKEMVADIIRESGCDFIGLQEAQEPQVEMLKKALPEYGFLATYNRVEKGSANAILYRKDKWEIGQEGVFWLSDTPEVAYTKTWGNKYVRYCAWARLVDKTSGQGVYFYNTHLSHHAADCREKGIKLAIERIAGREFDDPFVLVGDLNAEENEESMKYARGEAATVAGENCVNPLGLVDTFRVKRGQDVDAGTFNGFGKREPFTKIDYIYVRPGVRVLEADVNRYNKDGRYPSDHCPVTAMIEFE